MENNLYFIGIKCSLKDLSNRVNLVDDNVGYFSFWDKVCIIEYNPATEKFTVKENINMGEPQYFTGDENSLLHYLNENGIEVIVDDEPLGNIFRSYTAAYLELVRWAADIAYSKNYYYSLIEG